MLKNSEHCFTVLFETGVSEKKPEKCQIDCNVWLGFVCQIDLKSNKQLFNARLSQNISISQNIIVARNYNSDNMLSVQYVGIKTEINRRLGKCHHRSLLYDSEPLGGVVSYCCPQSWSRQHKWDDLLTQGLLEHLDISVTDTQL